MHGLAVEGEILVEEGVSGSVPVEDRPVGGRVFPKPQRGDIVIAAKPDRITHHCDIVETGKQKLALQEPRLSVVCDRGFVTSRFGVDVPRKSIGERPMTDAERQARCRAGLRASGTPAVRIRRPLDHRSRAKRWCDAISELTTLQGHYAAWLEALPENLQDSATAEALQAICDLDLTELQAIIPPRAFG